MAAGRGLGEMRIGIEGMDMLADHLTGVERSILQLVRALPAVDAQHEYVLYFNFVRTEYVRRFEERVHPLLSERVQARICRIPNWVMRIARNRFGWPIDFTLGPCDVVHYPHPQVCPQRRGARIVTFYDLLPLSHPVHYPAAEWVERFRRDAPQAARQADAIIAISHYTKAELIRLLSVPPEQITVVHLGVDPVFQPGSPEDVAALRRRLGLPRPYFLFVGTAEPRKNLPHLLEAVARCQAAGLKGMDLVLAGTRSWGTAAAQTRVAELGMEDMVRFPGYVAERDLPALYSGAEAFVLPSLTEGFGMPLLEAMACGTPVVGSRTTSIPEVVGDAGLLFDPEDVEDLASALTRVVTDSALRVALVARGRARAAQFSWERTAKETLAVYEAVA
jgi:glycosyltransferase involved in cell wall biosynthesis